MNSWITEILANLRKEGLLRTLNNVSVIGAKIICNGKEYVNFASNDYLGISADLKIQQDFLKELSNGNYNEFIMGATSSRLLGGNNLAYAQFESFLSAVYSKASGKEKSALLFNGGYHANTGILSALATSEDLILCDKLSHASIIDCLKLSDAKWKRFAHNDYGHLRKILSESRSQYKRVFIVTESVFSMDGDTADLQELVQIKNEFDAYLYVDEAHSIGVFGEDGLGAASESGVLSYVDFLMCTLGKACGSAGAFVICAPELRELLINRCRTFIFTTALAPINVMWSKFCFERLSQMQGRREHIAKLWHVLRKKIGYENTLGDTQIVPIIFGENQAATNAAKQLWNNGIYAPAVRYPTVPKGEARLRLSLTSDMDIETICRCADLIGELKNK